MTTTQIILLSMWLIFGLTISFDALHQAKKEREEEERERQERLAKKRKAKAWQ